MMQKRGLPEPEPLSEKESEDHLPLPPEDEAGRLDGTRDTHVYRDNGQFGSYPEFENYDDESMP